jgi:hypothetical protein
MCRSSNDTGGPRRCSGDTRAAYRKAAGEVAQLEAVAGALTTSDRGFTVAEGTWESPRGSLLTQVEQVDIAHLAKLYAAERDNVAEAQELFNKTDAKTRRAYLLGYRKPADVDRSGPSPATQPEPAPARTLPTAPADVQREITEAQKDSCYSAQRNLVAELCRTGPGNLSARRRPQQRDCRGLHRRDQSRCGELGHRPETGRPRAQCAAVR